MDDPINLGSAPALKHIAPANGQAAQLTLDTPAQREARRFAARTRLVNATSSPWGTWNRDHGSNAVHLEHYQAMLAEAVS